MTLREYRNKFIEQSKLIDELREENEEMSDALAEIRGIVTRDDDDIDLGHEDGDDENVFYFNDADVEVFCEARQWSKDNDEVARELVALADFIAFVKKQNAKQS